jgi:hypothetical protein
MNRHEIESVYAAWMRADLMFYHWDNSSKSKSPAKADFFATDPGAYILLGYALLFAVLEFLKERCCIPSTIDTEVKKVFGPLKRFRNAIFHVQDEYFSDKLKDIMRQRDSTKSIKHIHHEVGLYLQNLFHGKQT